MATVYNRIAIFSGTSEGYELALFLKKSGNLDKADFYVATDYGETTFTDLENVNVIQGRLTEKDMAKVFSEKKYSLVIDSTHPYADIVTANIKAACDETEVEYIRLLRAEEPVPKGVTLVENIEEAARALDKMEGKFLLTTGAKELKKYSKIRDFSQRAVARVLPSHMSLDNCEEAGVQSKYIIGMQGPFTREMNIATMEQFGLDILVTKNTGRAGGFAEKTALAKEGYRVLVIGRPAQESGLSIEEVKERLGNL